MSWTDDGKGRLIGMAEMEMGTPESMFRSIGNNTFVLRDGIRIPETKGPLLLCDDVPPTQMTREEFFAAHPQYAYTWDRDRHIKGNGTDGIDDGLCVCRECRELSQKGGGEMGAQGYDRNTLTQPKPEEKKDGK